MIKLGLSKSEVGGVQNNLPDGDYTVEVKSVQFKDSTNPATKGTQVFITEFLVRGIRYQRDSKDLDGNDITSVELGEKRSWAPNTRHQPTAGRIKQFLQSVTGETDGKTAWAELCDIYKVESKYKADVEKQCTNAGDVDYWDCVGTFAVSERNPFAGLPVDVQVTRVITKGSKKSFAVHDWRSVSEDGTDEAA